MKERRIPRNSGLTWRMKKYHSMEEGEGKEIELERIKKQLLRDWVKDGFRILGEIKDVGEMAEFLNWQEKKVVKEIMRAEGNMMGKDGKEGARALFSMIFGGAMASRGLIMGQARALISSQGNQYVPFLTSEVNRALANLLQSDNTLISLLRTIQSPANPSVPIQINNSITNGKDAPEALMNTNQAVKLIDAKREESLLESEVMQAKLIPYLGPDVPEVLATQQGQTTDMATGPGPKKKKHIERREQDGDIIEPEIIGE